MSGHERLSWEPERAGDVYCSPACGRGCTLDEFLRATKMAKRLAKLLPGFNPVVHENMGWFYRAKVGKVAVTGPYDPEAKEWGPFSATYDSGVYGKGDTPAEALDDMLRLKRDSLEQFEAEVSEISAAAETAKGEPDEE